jgi:protein ImuB
MPLWIGIHLLTHSLDTLFPLWPTDTPVAVVLQQGRVHAATPMAQALGLRPGMRRSTVQALAPGAVLQVRNVALEEQRLQQIALELLQYTPNLALGPDHARHTLLLEVADSLQLFKGPRNLCRLVRASLRRHQAPHHLGMAPTAQGARILACQNQSARRRSLQTETLRRRLDPLPAGMLPADQTHLDWLENLGCHTLEHVRNLPREGVRLRCSPDIIRELDAAYGFTVEPCSWFKAPEIFSQRYDPQEYLEHVHAVQAVATKLIEQLCAWLDARQCAADTLVFLLHHEKGRHARPPSRLLLLLSRAGWRSGDFLHVLAEQLQQFVLPAHVVAVELSIPAIQPRPAPLAGLFPEPAQWQEDEARLLDVLRARLGAAQVLEPRPEADHRPELANAWKAAAPGLQRPGPGQSPCGPPGPQARPFWLLPQPYPLETLRNRPVYKGMILRLVKGPERIESGWWEDGGGDRRDYFIAEDAQSARYWVYRQRESLEAGWFLHGLFG